MANQPNKYSEIPLLPHSFRYAGYLLVTLSFGAAYLYYFGGRPPFFEVPVFAVVTSYAETRWFVFAQTNALDEMAIIFALMGLIAIGFSRDKNENEQLYSSRVKAIYYAAYLTTALWILLYLTIFGWPVIPVSAGVFVFFLIIYILVFRLLVAIERVKEIDHLNNNLNTEERHEK